MGLVSRVSFLVPLAPVRGQLNPGELPSFSGCTMEMPHLQEYLALHLRPNPRGPVETGETNSRLWLEVEGFHRDEVPVGAT